jgi:hypothetical protein
VRRSDKFKKILSSKAGSMVRVELAARKYRNQSSRIVNRVPPLDLHAYTIDCRPLFEDEARIVARVPVCRIVPHSDAARMGALCDLIVTDAERLFASRDCAVLIPTH